MDFSYRKQLEQLRSRLSENRPSPFKHETAKEQLKEIKQEGLMRRGKISEPKQEEGMAQGIGMAIAEALSGDAPEYLEGKSPKPVLKPYEIPNSGDRDSFVEKLIQSESSGRSGVSRTNDDGETYVGLGQFGKDRLADYKRATGEKFTQEQFRNNVPLQNRVMDWHIHSIDKAIAETEGASKWDRDGLRAVAHLGGISGMKDFVKTNGKYNPKDQEGTSLFKYYHKFSNKPTS